MLILLCEREDNYSNNSNMKLYLLRKITVQRNYNKPSLVFKRCLNFNLNAIHLIRKF